MPKQTGGKGAPREKNTVSRRRRVRRTKAKPRAVELPSEDTEFSTDLFGPPKVTESEKLEFLIDPQLPKHMLSMVAGNPGAGKSLFVAWLTAMITTGSPWPFTGEVRDPGIVLLMAGEDPWSRGTLPRLEEAGANIENVRVMKAFKTLDRETTAELRAYVEAVQPDLVVIDTFAKYMGSGRDMHRQNEVAEFLGDLNDLADDANCAILGVGHLNKNTAEDPLFRIMGSVGFQSACRSIMFLGTDPEDRDRPALAHGQINLTERGRTVVFDKIRAEGDRHPVLKPLHESDASYIDVCAPIETVADPGRPPNESNTAREFILNFLERVDEPVRWADLLEEAERRNMPSEPTFISARTKLLKDRLIKQVGQARNARWQLRSS